MKRNTKSALVFALTAGMVFSNAVVSVDAKAKKPVLSKSKITITVGQKQKIKVKKAKPKKTTWSLPKAGKKIVSLSKKKKTEVTIKGKKAGKATLTAKIKVGKKNYKKKVKITVKNAKPATVVKPTVNAGGSTGGSNAGTTGGNNGGSTGGSKATPNPGNSGTKPTAEPTASAKPSAKPSADPTATPVPEATATPAPEATATPVPTATPEVITPQEVDGTYNYGRLSASDDFVATVNGKTREISGEDIEAELSRTFDLKKLCEKADATTKKVEKTLCGVTVTATPASSNAGYQFDVTVSGTDSRWDRNYAVAYMHTSDTTESICMVEVKDNSKINPMPNRLFIAIQHLDNVGDNYIEIYINENWDSDDSSSMDINNCAKRLTIHLDENKKFAFAVLEDNELNQLAVFEIYSDGTYGLYIDKAEADKRGFVLAKKK